MWDNAGGRLSGYVAVTTLVRLGPAWAPLVSVLALASVMAGMYFLIHQWWPAATSLAVSVTIAACSAFLVQSPVQNFLWVTGVGQVTIGIGVALGVITIAVYAGRHTSWSVRTLLAIVGLLGLCFYEVINLYVLVGAAGLWFISQDVRHDVGKRWALGILSSAALLTLIVMTVAPGSRERVAEERPTLVHAVKHAVIMSAEFWWRIATSPALYLAFFVGFLVVSPSRLSWRWREVADSDPRCGRTRRRHVRADEMASRFHCTDPRPVCGDDPARNHHDGRRGCDAHTSCSPPGSVIRGGRCDRRSPRRDCLW